jgi:tRNA A-37 threonylcarbamoyl transferase component Bud32
MTIGQTIAHYRILEKLGQGGMGVVYKARDTRLDRFVALKILPPDKVADPERKRCFVQEAKAASALNHPNIVTIYDIGAADGTDFIAMEYVPGRTLDQLIPGKGLKLKAALGYAMQMADALAKAHTAGIIHRDLKPSNVMINDDDVVKILDFGLAKLAEPGDAAISPDGKLAAYSSDREDGNLDIYVQQLAGRQPIRLTRHEAMESQPSFSPDGSRIVYRSERDGGGIYVIDTLGGEERKIADRGYRPRFSPDGSMISYGEVPPFPGRGRIYLVSARGGAPRRFLPEYEVAPWPREAGARWSGDGKFLLFSGIRGGDPKTRDWWVAPIDGGPPVATNVGRSLQLTTGIQFPCAWTDRYVIFVQGTTIEGANLYRIPIAPGSWKISGTAQRLTSGPGIHWAPSLASDWPVMMRLSSSRPFRATGHAWPSPLSPVGEGGRPRCACGIWPAGAKRPSLAASRRPPFSRS